MPKFISGNAGAFLIIAFAAFAALLNIGVDWGIMPGKAGDLLANFVMAVALVALFATVFIYK
jgi:hypothetical protein